MRSIALPHSARVGPAPRPLLLDGRGSGWFGARLRTALITVAVLAFAVTLAR